MKNAKRVIIPVVIVLVVLLALNSCKDTLGAAIDQATGCLLYTSPSPRDA